ncbi:hypothetical protein REJC140_02170 [Pseudorhizobium endolithicum]|uniref:PhoP regulatory network protein YrbL n=1 Tax=Pseudorhizobium endolithicum TaxID=1191678 RepID=A0ABM8PY24_9HYPH|nr:YrbL family protein [Pseudorhizobium endolithicum]CAD6424566.1 hypothetical protein REQ54_02636 [Rhizobium sp. Q54]CAD7054483.1 hypothetical protein REJC140_02170 [Pseudorhizobium endolithicum]
MIHLKDTAPVAAGNNAAVYRHPQDRSVLVKVVRPEAMERYKARWDFLRGRRRRFFHLKNFMRVFEEQVAMYAVEGHASAHLEEVIGLVGTDMGPGLVVRCETYRGEIAPTLANLVASRRFDRRMLSLLDDFFTWLEQSPIVASDLSFRNLVLSDRLDNEPRIVLIDGYGENAAIPLKSWSQSLNRYDKRRKADKLRARLRAAADPAETPSINT